MHCVFHGIRFKVNKDWLSGIDSLLFYIPFFTILPLFIPLYYLFIDLLNHSINENIIFASIIQ
ncbi:hypothetical protein E5981_04335 [Bacteroides faecichinchillae]|nr:hypothetical protein E5981_04335 [Bacteroides faecichinchillae]